MLKKIHHIGIAVADLEAAVEFYSRNLGLTLSHREEMEEQKVEVAIFPMGEFQIELLQGTDEDSPISKFIQKRGEGLHHLCFQVDDIKFALVALKEKGIKLVDETPKIGAQGQRVAFIHPRSAQGVLIELVEV